MSQDKDFERGLIQRRSVLGDAWVDRSLANSNSFTAEFQSLITRFAWKEIWERPGLDHKTRRFLVLVMTTALGRWEEFELHLRAAAEGGVTPDEIKEVLLQSAVYCGVPAANTAFKLAQHILQQLGHQFAPQSPGGMPAGPALRSMSEGRGTAVVMAHALGCDLSMWDGVVRALPPGCEVLRYDHRGHGGSEVPAGPYAMDDLVDDAARMIRAWDRGPVLFVGLSMGGMVAQGVAVRYPELVRGVVIANSTSFYPDAARAMWQQRIARVEAGGTAAIADGVMARYFSDDFRAAQPHREAAARDVLLATDAAGYVAACHAVMNVDYREALPGVTCPALVIAGDLDQGTPVEMSRDMAGRIPGARLEVIAGASHLSAVEKPEVFAGLLGAWMAGDCAGLTFGTR